MSQPSISRCQASHYQISRYKDYAKISFYAMASPCEVLIRNNDDKFCHQVAQLATNETKRIEIKFSRYLKDNWLDRMNQSGGRKISIDQETFKLLGYAKQLFELSDGLFDITSGVLRKIWQFNAQSKPPNEEQIKSIIKLIGFDLIDYNQKQFSLPKNMQIDFGGIGKEYAVDQVARKISPICEKHSASFLVNFGGDLAAVKFQPNDPAWLVGIESVDNQVQAPPLIKISTGGVATSGNNKRFFDYQGVRYGHLLNPITGYPIQGSPQSISTFSDHCVLAGSFSSLAMLQGEQAENFLTQQSIQSICIW